MFRTPFGNKPTSRFEKFEILIFVQHYIEQGTGLRFRSLIAVQRYLTEANRSTATPKVLKQADQLSAGLVALSYKTKKFLFFWDPRLSISASSQNSSNSGSRNNKNSSYSYSARVVRRDRLERGEDTIALKELKLSSCSTVSSV